VPWRQARRIGPGAKGRPMDGRGLITMSWRVLCYTPISAWQAALCKPRAPRGTLQPEGTGPWRGVSGSALGLPVPPRGNMGLVNGSTRRAHRWFRVRDELGRWEKPVKQPPVSPALRRKSRAGTESKGEELHAQRQSIVDKSRDSTQETFRARGRLQRLSCPRVPS
jgi:hypothetical protein